MILTRKGSGGPGRRPWGGRKAFWAFSRFINRRERLRPNGGDDLEEDLFKVRKPGQETYCKTKFAGPPKEAGGEGTDPSKDRNLRTERHRKFRPCTKWEGSGISYRKRITSERPAAEKRLLQLRTGGAS